MCFVSADPCFGRFFGNELAVTVNLGNVNFPGLKLAPLVTKLLSVFPSTCSPEVRPAARNFHLLTQGWHSQSRAVLHPRARLELGASARSLPPPSPREDVPGALGPQGQGNSVEILRNEGVLWNYCITAGTQRWLFLPESSLEFIKQAWLAGLLFPGFMSQARLAGWDWGTAHGVESLPTCPP